MKTWMLICAFILWLILIAGIVVSLVLWDWLYVILAFSFCLIAGQILDIADDCDDPDFGKY